MNNELNIYIENASGDFAVKKVVVENAKVLGFDSSLNPVMVTPTGTAPKNAIGFMFSGGTPATGFLVKKYIPYGMTITGWEAVSNVGSGSIQIDIKKSTYAGYPTTSSIVASAPPVITTAQKATSNTLTGWTTSLNEGDWVEFYITSITSFTELTFILKVS